MELYSCESRNTKDCQLPPGARRGKERIYPESYKELGSADVSISDF